MPVADKTFYRPIVGRFFRAIAKNVVPITRLRDNTWKTFLQELQPKSLVIVAPEGRMKRANGLDIAGNPMTVRGGIADLLRPITSGRMLIAYSGGLHHVQVPSQRIPRHRSLADCGVSKRIRIRQNSLRSKIPRPPKNGGGLRGSSILI